MQMEERRLLTARVDRQRRVAILTRRLSVLAACLSFVLILLAAWLMAIDSGKRKQAERALAARDEQYRQVVEMAGDMICRTDHLGRFTFCNQASLTMLRLTQGEVIGRS